MIGIGYLLFILYSYTFQSQFLNELKLHEINENELRSIIQDQQNSHFVAFFEEKDLNARNIELLSSIIQVQQNLQEQISFYWYNKKIPKDIELKYYLHYYTLPKLKFFEKDKHLTYRGGRSVKNVENWVNKKFLITKSSLKQIKNLQELFTILKQKQKILIYIGKDTSKNFQDYIKNASKLQLNEVYYTQANDIYQKFQDLNFSNGHILSIEYGIAEQFTFNRYLQKRISSQLLEKFFQKQIQKQIYILTQDFFIQIAKLKENYFFYFGEKDKFRYYQKFCQNNSMYGCTQITHDLQQNQQLFRNYFPLNTQQPKVFFVEGHIYHQRYPIFQLDNFNSLDDLKNFQKNIQQKNIDQVMFTENKSKKVNNIYYFAYKDFYEQINNLNSDVLVLFHDNDCGQICEDFIKESEKISQIYQKKYGDKFAFKFGLYNMFKNTTPFDIDKKVTFYIFPKSNIKNHVKAFVARDMTFLESFILKNSPALNEIEFDEL